MCPPTSIRRAGGGPFATKATMSTEAAAGSATQDDEATLQAHHLEAEPEEAEEAEAAAQWTDDLEDYLESLDCAFANLPEQGFAAQSLQCARDVHIA